MLSTQEMDNQGKIEIAAALAMAVGVIALDCAEIFRLGAELLFRNLY